MQQEYESTNIRYKRKHCAALWALLLFLLEVHVAEGLLLCSISVVVVLLLKWSIWILGVFAGCELSTFSSLLSCESHSFYRTSPRFCWSVWGLQLCGWVCWQTLCDGCRRTLQVNPVFMLSDSWGSTDRTCRLLSRICRCRVKLSLLTEKRSLQVWMFLPSEREISSTGATCDWSVSFD